MTEPQGAWLVAVWPGMGAVAHLAGSVLVQGLGAQPEIEIPPGEHFGAVSVSVRDGILQPSQRPRTIVTRWRDPAQKRDLVILLAEGQPTLAERGYCEKLLAAARALGVARVFTFAALATDAPADAPARVFAAGTDSALLVELQLQGAELLARGEIGGLNGFFLAVAAEQGIPGACLLGEIPFVASGVLNPKASAAVLRVFSRAVGLTLDLSELDRQAQEVERHLLSLSRPVRGRERGAGPDPAVASSLPGSGEARVLSRFEESHIEALFREAGSDRSHAMELKSELDRLGVFERYEDRFLDLFRRAE